MKFTIAAVSCMIEKETGEIIMDPDSTQLKVSIIMIIRVMSYLFIIIIFHESYLFTECKGRIYICI